MTQRISILHISDLHRDPQNPIRNGALLDSLENDRRHYTLESECKIRSPDVIIVSGDVIQGVKPGTDNPDVRLAEQYREALEFLGRLTDTLVEGDRQRVVIVPGNHDVSACHCMQSMRRVDVIPARKKEFVSQLFSHGSSLRWSWSDFELYEINDVSKYKARFKAFATFYGEFYRGARSYDIEPSKQFDIFDFPDFNLTVAGFSSCFNNDILNKQGTIHPECIAEAGMRFRKSELQNRLRIAVWHHNTEGVPMQSAYMDSDTLQNLIDCGFSLGFHGHQHRPQFLDTRFRYGGSRRITVISAGTLCGSASYRYGRAYNVIELETETRTGRLHLREMQNDNLQLPIWGSRSLPLGTSGYLDFAYDPAPEPLVRSDEQTSVLLRAQKLYEERDYQKAVEVLGDLGSSNDLARRLLLECLQQLRDFPEIIARFDPPTSAIEAIYLMDALWKDGRRERLAAILGEPVIAKSADLSVIELRKKYLAKIKNE